MVVRRIWRRGSWVSKGTREVRSGEGFEREEGFLGREGWVFWMVFFFYLYRVVVGGIEVRFGKVIFCL